MARYFLELAYNGAAYCGWQIQSNAQSVQQTLQEAISKLLRQNILVVGAGRTDTGVHATYYVAHFDTESIDINNHLLYHLNANLPKDIVVYSMQEVSVDLHARFSAQERTYRYYVLKRKSPFFHNLAMRQIAPPDLEAMNRAANYLLEVDDFTSFAKLHTDNKTNICSVKSARWSESNEMYVFEICADRFLRNMVRSLVGTLLDIGRDKITYDKFIEIVAAKDRSRASSSASAQGLYLTGVVYDRQLFRSQYSSGEMLSL